MQRISTIVLTLLLTLQAIVCTAQPYILRYGMNGTQYQQLFDSLSPRGYVPQHIDIVNVGGTLYYTGVWLQEKEVTWEARHNLTEKEYQKMFDVLSPKSYIPYSLTVYQNEQGQLRFAAIWKKQAHITFIARHGLNEAQYTQLLDEFRQKRMFPYSLAVYEDGGTTKFAVAAQSEENISSTPTIERHHLSTEASQAVFDDLSPKGYMPTELIGYSLKNKVNFAILWAKTGLAWQARHNLSPEQLQSYENTFHAQHYYPYRIKGYSNKGKLNYVAAWFAY